MTCKTHPDAPHGFVRDASHTEDRYVCECEFWEEPEVIEKIKAGANIHAGDGGYSIGTKEAYEAFVKIRNKSLEETRDKE